MFNCDVHKKATLVPQTNEFHSIQSIAVGSFLILSSTLRLKSFKKFLVFNFPHQPNFYIPSIPLVPHVLPIASFFIFST